MCSKEIMPDLRWIKGNKHERILSQLYKYHQINVFSGFSKYLLEYLTRSIGSLARIIYIKEDAGTFSGTDTETAIKLCKPWAVI